MLDHARLELFPDPLFIEPIIIDQDEKSTTMLAPESHPILKLTGGHPERFIRGHVLEAFEEGDLVYGQEILADVTLEPVEGALVVAIMAGEPIVLRYRPGITSMGVVRYILPKMKWQMQTIVYS